MKNLWAWTYSLLLFLSLALILWKINPQNVFGEKLAQKQIKIDDSGDKLLLVLIEGLNESEFSKMLADGELPHLSKLIKKNSSGIPVGVYSSIEDDIISNEKVNYESFLKGSFSNSKSIYSYLKENQYYKPIKLKNELWDEYFTEEDPIANDFTRVVKFLSFVTPELDYKLETYRSFNEGNSPFVKNSGGKLWQTYQIFKHRISTKEKINRLPRFSLINLKSPSVIGNKVGITSEYRENLIRVDQLLGSLFGVLKKFKLDKELNIMITSSFSRNSKLISQYKVKVPIPFIVSGPNLNYQSTNKYFDPEITRSTSLIHTQSLNLMRIKPEKNNKKGRSIASADDSVNFWY